MGTKVEAQGHQDIDSNQKRILPEWHRDLLIRSGGGDACHGLNDTKNKVKSHIKDDGQKNSVVLKQLAQRDGKVAQEDSQYRIDEDTEEEEEAIQVMLAQENLELAEKFIQGNWQTRNLLGQGDACDDETAEEDDQWGKKVPNQGGDQFAQNQLVARNRQGHGQIALSAVGIFIETADHQEEGRNQEADDDNGKGKNSHA